MENGFGLILYLMIFKPLASIRINHEQFKSRLFLCSTYVQLNMEKNPTVND